MDGVTSALENDATELKLILKRKGVHIRRFNKEELDLVVSLGCSLVVVRPSSFAYFSLLVVLEWVSLNMQL
jgi:hypothetical protein